MEKQNSAHIKKWSDPGPGRRQSRDSYEEYLPAMKRVHQHSLHGALELTPRERHRKSKSKPSMEGAEGSWDERQATRVSTVVSMVPDEVIYKHSDYCVRTYESALMFIDVSGFTELCEIYTKSGRGGPSKLTQVLNSYIGAMVQEILTHKGDVLKFAGDAFLSMWKKTSTLTMQDIVHAAIDCGLIIQKNYGAYVTDVGVVLKVKVAISAGLSHFSIIGDEHKSHYVIVGQPVWDVKTAEYMSSAGDVLTAASAWAYVNEAEYCTQPCGDGRHTKVLGVGATWKRVEKIDYAVDSSTRNSTIPINRSFEENSSEMNYREFSQRHKTQKWPLVGGSVTCAVMLITAPVTESPTKAVLPYHSKMHYMPLVFAISITLVRPAMVAALRSWWWPALRRFMDTPVLLAVDNDEPMDFLTEVRHVVVVFLNIITRTVTEEVLIGVVASAYKCVCSVAATSGGLVNKLSMFDKDMMFLLVFGLRGLKHELEAQKALLCAFQLKDSLNDPNMISVSIGITSGTTYCGVLGHVLRREYTVIGSAVNKAARLMMAYTDKITCDKETFVRSKLDLDLFRLMEHKPLKGFAEPGPVYEFNKPGWPERVKFWRHPLLGRNEEMSKFKSIFENALARHQETFTRYQDHKYGVAVVGSRLSGKTRLVDEFLNITPSSMVLEKIYLVENEKAPYALIRLVWTKILMGSVPKSLRDSIENRIRHSLGSMSLSPLQIYAVNTIFDCRFPLPENFAFSGDLLNEYSVRQLIIELCNSMAWVDLSSTVLCQSLPSLRVVTIEDAQHVDDESWRLLLLMLENKNVFLLLTLDDRDNLTRVAQESLGNHMIVKIHLMGIGRWYHAALACQLLDVQAIPADLEKIIESASGGLPGWIQNFLISLIQRGELTVVTLPRGEAVEAGAVLPASSLLRRADDNFTSEVTFTKRASFQSMLRESSYAHNLDVFRESSNMSPMSGKDNIQMAALADSFNVNNIKLDMTMDVVILKTYDSLTPFEKWLLKCSAVLGEVFSRRMLLHLLHSDSPRKVAQAVAKLFEIRVLECEGGDFTRDTSLVLVHPAPTPGAAKVKPYCSCLGTKQPSNCRDLPLYAFCGYLKFKHSLFRSTTYELLTESQKHEMHARALLYLERYTRRCTSCGEGCFTRLFGVRSDDGLVRANKALKRVRQQMAALSAETRMTTETQQESPFETDYTPGSMISQRHASNIDVLELEEMKRLSHSAKMYRKAKRVRSFSSLELENCECLPILLSVYNQVIEHCRGAGENEKLFETYIEFADLSIINLNIPQAIRLLSEVEDFVSVRNICDNANHAICNVKWMKEFELARILTLRGACMLESGDDGQARINLLRAMELSYNPFPSSKLWVRISDFQASFQQFITLYVAPRLYTAVDSGLVGDYYDHIARTLNKLYRLFCECKEMDNATLAAKWALKYALRSNSSFRLLCISYADMISVYRQKQKFSKCLNLEKQAMEICHRKRGQLDVLELHSVCSLYTSLFLFYVECGKKLESLQFGLSVIPMMANFSDLVTCQMLVLWMLKLLLSEKRVPEMVMIMREFFYMTDHYDLSSETWYYFYSVVILLDTGYCVEPYASCEKFYIKKGDAILRSRTPEAAWNFFVSMWLLTIRVGAWERSIMWEEKIKQLVMIRFQQYEFNIMVMVRLVEGYLITMVNEIDNRNIKKILSIEKTVKTIFKMIKSANKNDLYRPRYFLLSAYYHYIRGKKTKAYKLLNKSTDMAKQFEHATMLVWAEHTRNHWRGTLNPKYEEYWAQHIEAGNLLYYTDFDVENGKIIPYTLPLPLDSEK